MCNNYRIYNILRKYTNLNKETICKYVRQKILVLSDKVQHYQWAVQPETYLATAYNICELLLSEHVNSNIVFPNYKVSDFNVEAFADEYKNDYAFMNDAFHCYGINDNNLNTITATMLLNIFNLLQDMPDLYKKINEAEISLNSNINVLLKEIEKNIIPNQNLNRDTVRNLNNAILYKIFPQTLKKCRTRLIGTKLFKMFSEEGQHENYEIIRAVIYNIKHGIELYIKCLSIINLGLYFRVHDIKKLLKYYKEIFNPITKNIINVLEKKIYDKIKKYYFGGYINEELRKFDDFNTAERYPEGKAYSIPGNHSFVSVELVYEIMNDIILFQKEFNIASNAIWNSRMREIKY